MLGRAVWTGLSLFVLTAPALHVDGVAELLGAPEVEQRVEVPAPQLPAPVPLPPLAADVGVQAGRARASLSIRVLGAETSEGAPADAPAPPARHTRMGGTLGMNLPSQAALVVASLLRDERDEGLAFTPDRAGMALAGFAPGPGERFLVGRGALVAERADGTRVECGLTALAAFVAWGEHVRMAVRPVDAQLSCPPLSSNAPRLEARDGAWVGQVEGRGNAQLLVLGAQAEGGTPLAYVVALADGTRYRFEGTLRDLQGA